VVEMHSGTIFTKPFVIPSSFAVGAAKEAAAGGKGTPRGEEEAEALG